MAPSTSSTPTSMTIREAWKASRVGGYELRELDVRVTMPRNRRKGEVSRLMARSPTFGGIA